MNINSTMKDINKTGTLRKTRKYYESLNESYIETQNNQTQKRMKRNSYDEYSNVKNNLNIITNTKKESI